MSQNPPRLDCIELSQLETYNKKYGRKWIRLIAHFNCLLRDERSRYYSETLNISYFQGSQKDWDSYKRKIAPAKPIDFKVVRKKIVEGKYEHKSDLIADVRQVFLNSQATGLIDWVRPAKRMLAIWDKITKDSNYESSRKLPHALWQAAELDGQTRACRDCGYACSTKDQQPSDGKFTCASCAKVIRGAGYACYNHKETPRYYCQRCTIPACGDCWQDRNNLESVDLAVCLFYVLYMFIICYYML